MKRIREVGLGRFCAVENEQEKTTSRTCQDTKTPPAPKERQQTTPPSPTSPVDANAPPSAENMA